MNNTEIVCVAEALGLLDEPKERNYWVHPLNQDRINIKKQFFKFYNDLRDYPDKFFEFYRMSVPSFDELLSKVILLISKQNTSFRESISAEERLTITLR